MIYEKDVENLNQEFIDQNIIKYKNFLLQCKNINDILIVLHKIMYKMNYYLNIVDFKQDEEEKDNIIESINSFNNEILNAEITINNKKYFLLPLLKQNKSYVNKHLNNFYNFYLNILDKRDFKIKIYNFEQIIKNYDYEIIGVSVKNKSEYNQSLTVSNITTLTVYNIVEDYDYDLVSNKESKDDDIVKLKLKPNTYKFVNQKLNNRSKRIILNKIFNNQFNKNVKNNPLYVILCYYMYNISYIQKNNSSLLTVNNLVNKNFKNANQIQNFILDFNKELNDNYIKNYIDIFEKYNSNSNTINFNDLQYFINQNKNSLNKSIGYFNFDDIINYIKKYLEIFKITIENIDNIRFNVYFKKLLIAQWHFNFDNFNIKKPYFNMLFNRYKVSRDRINIIYIRMDFNCLSNEIDFKNLNKLFGYIGYCIFFSINVNDTMINKTDKQKIFKHLLKSILFYDIDNLLTLLKKQDIKDYIIDYLNSDIIYKYKKHLLSISLDINIFYNTLFMKKMIEIIDKSKDDVYLKIVKEMITEYNKCFTEIYKTENYSINSDIFQLFNVFKTNSLPFQGYNSIYSNIICSELFYNYTVSKLDFDKLIQFINDDNYDIYNVIKRKPNYKTLIYGTIKTEKDYKTLTEGVNMIMETESVNDLKI